MIGYLEGEVLASEEGKLLLKTSDGVGREVFFKEIREKKTALYISQIIKEKSIELYGFESYQYKKFFESLLSVNGVGPKSAYSLITSLGVDQLITAITFEDIKTLKKAPGIGPKAAKQIVLDLKDKIADKKFKTLNVDTTQSDFIQNNHSIYQEAVFAFKELGFDEGEVNPLIKRSLELKDFSKSEDLIKEILIQLNN